MKKIAKKFNKRGKERKGRVRAKVCDCERAIKIEGEGEREKGEKDQKSDKEGKRLV